MNLDRKALLLQGVINLSDDGDRAHGHPVGRRSGAAELPIDQDPILTSIQHS